MNRRERRQTAKKLGITKYQKNLSRTKKFDLIRENIIAGRQKEEEMKETVRQHQSENIDQKESEAIYNLANDIAKQKKLPIIDVMAEAQIEFDKQRK